MLEAIAKLGRRLTRITSGPLLFYMAHPWALGRGIVAGPFKGTRMTLRTTWNNPIYLFVGSYERELHWIWNELPPAKNKVVWVIGAAEGYYACGIAKKWNTRVTAYEASHDSRSVLAENILLNGLEEKVEVLGRCENAEFAARIKCQAPDLLLCDIEGSEDDIFSDDLLSSLTQTTLVIEMHPPYGSRSMVESLANTHDVRIVNPVARCVADYPYRDWIPNPIKLAWLNERRPFPTPWLVALPRL